MKTPLTLGLDIGTGSAKGLLASPDGRVHEAASAAYQYTRLPGGGAEQNPEDWWKAACSICHELLRRVPDARERIQAVAVSGQGVAAVLLGQGGRVLRNAILYLDTRPNRFAQELAPYTDRFVSLSGKAPGSYNVEPKLLWVRAHEPDIWAQVWKHMTTTAYLTWRLCGQAVMNHSDGGILLGYDLAHNTWSDELLACMDLPRSIYCELAPSDSIVGAVTAEAAAATGLREGTPVVAGGEDTSSSGLAIGAFTERQAQLSMGTAGTVNVPRASIRTHPGLLAFPHVLRGMTLLGGSMVSGGLAIDWAARLLGQSWHALTTKAAKVPAGAGGLIFLPYLAGELQPVNDGAARGVLFGLTAQTEDAHAFRAVLEGVAYAIVDNLLLATEQGHGPEEIIAVGGPVVNDVWCQVVADAAGLPLKAMEDCGGAALGSAILAAMGAGLIAAPEGMQEAHARLRRVFLPTPENTEAYRRGLGIYRELYPRLRDLMPRLLSVAHAPLQPSTTGAPGLNMEDLHVPV